MYKDKGKQREANKERQRRYKARQKGVTSEGVTDKALLIPYDRTPEGLVVGIKAKAKDFHSLPADVQRSIMRISEDDGEVRRRTSNALSYQKMFPNSVHRGTGL